jgi:hypothetical protein
MTKENDHSMTAVEEANETLLITDHKINMK